MTLSESKLLSLMNDDDFIVVTSKSHKYINWGNKGKFYLKVNHFNS